MMDMMALFDDFMRYVDSMDEDAVKCSIANAAAHTSDSYILDGVPDYLQLRTGTNYSSDC